MTIMIPKAILNNQTTAAVLQEVINHLSKKPDAVDDLAKWMSRQRPKVQKPTKLHWSCDGKPRCGLDKNGQTQLTENIEKVTCKMCSHLVSGHIRNTLADFIERPMPKRRPMKLEIPEFDVSETQWISEPQW